MLGSYYVRLRYWFYPTGNTPAVNLLRDTCIEQDEPIQILSLGCGDVRSVLYTTWCEATYKLRFTCCDFEPAVLARNIVLFASLIQPKTKPDYPRLWNLYYHFFVPQADADFLLELLRDLLLASESLPKWQSSTYGSVITLLSSASLEAVRAFWQQYVDLLALEGTEKDSYDRKARSQLAEIHSKHVGTRTIMTGMRSSGAQYFQAMEVVPIAFSRFWQTGVAAGNSEDVAALKGSSAINPLFAISSSPAGTVAVHYGTDPLLGFHLAEAFDSPNKEMKLARMVSTAKRQFQEWCTAFHEAATSGRVTCAFHYGDALSFCQKLQWLPYNRAPLNVTQWDSTQLVLSSSATDIIKSFDVIDTSNLMDHVGLLALLPATVPLLSEKSTSVLHTESLLQAAENPTDSLNAMLLSDSTTTFLLFGLAPTGYLTGVSTDMTSTNDLISTMWAGTGLAGQKQFLIRMPWKFTAPGKAASQTHLKRPSGILEFEHEPLIEHFLGIYKQMFAREDITQLSQITIRQNKTRFASDGIYYTRANFAMVLALARQQISTNWTRLVELLIEKITHEKSMAFGFNYLQELIMWLHIFGVYDDKYFTSPLESQTYFQTSSQATQKRLPLLFNAPFPPAIVYISLTVPNDRIRIVLDILPEKIGTPTLSVEISNYKKRLSCCFQSINASFFESPKTKNQKDNAAAYNSSFKVTCAVPSSVLLIGSPKDIFIGLGVNPSHSSPTLVSLLGLDLKIFETSLADDQRIDVLPNPPGYVADANAPPSLFQDLAAQSEYVRHVEFSPSKKAQSLRAHVELAQNEKLSSVLASGAAVSVEQAAPCVVQLRIGDQSQQVVFPYPVNAAAVKLRIARKSSWVEIKAPLSSAGQAGGYDLERFPVILANDKIVPWALSAIDLDRSAMLRDSSETKWVDAIMDLSLSANDREVNRMDTEDKSPMLQLKESIHLIFAGFLKNHPGAMGKRISGFQLMSNGDDCDTIILANSVRYDAASASIALDAHVICFSHSRMQKMLPALQTIPHETFMSIKMSKEEETLWKALLPALVERARGHKWKHGRACEYLRFKKVPSSTQHGDAPICTCGEGKDLSTSSKSTHLKLCSKFATRIALAPLAAVPYVEAIAETTTFDSLQRELQSELQSDKPVGSPGCDSCGALRDDVKACSRCGRVKYCDQKCQKADWKRHKPSCTPKN